MVCPTLLLPSFSRLSSSKAVMPPAGERTGQCAAAAGHRDASPSPRRSIFSDFAAQTYARNMVDVRSRVTGYVDRWLFQPGAEVAAGQVLYVSICGRLRQRGAGAGQLAASEADLDFAQKQFRSCRRRRAWLREPACERSRTTNVSSRWSRPTPLRSRISTPPSPHARRRRDREGNKATANKPRSLPYPDRFHEGRVGSNQGALHAAELNLESAPFARLGGRIGDSLVPWAGW